MFSLRFRSIVLPLMVLVAGCTAPGGHDDPAALDTGLIPPGGEATLTVEAAGILELHCDPHPFMTHNVTVEPGGPPTEHVHIFDGPTQAEYRFEPQKVRVAPGAVVTYHNHGTFGHTASQMTASMQH